MIGRLSFIFGSLLLLGEVWLTYPLVLALGIGALFVIPARQTHPQARNLRSEPDVS